MGNAARLFNGEAEQTLYLRVTPTDEQMEFLRTQWKELADQLKQDLADHGFPVSTWIQGSYKFHTLIRPVHKDEEYDVDVGLYFTWDARETRDPPTPEQLRERVQRELIAYSKTNAAVRRVIEPPKERCSRALYKQQFHIDIPTYHLDPYNDTRRLACLSGVWEHSDPKALYLWFKNAVDVEHRALLRRQVRYLKGWAAVAFADAPEARPSSVLMTVLAAEALAQMHCTGALTGGDDDILIGIISVIYERLQRDRRVFNPVDNLEHEDLNRIHEDAWGEFISRLTILYGAAQAAESSEDEAAAALAWESAFSFLMPLPEADEMEVVENSSGRALMQVPDIEVRVLDREGGTLLATYRNEVPSVSKGHWLDFRIINPDMLPAFSEVSWTVRNDGVEAERTGDPGHMRRGIGMVSAGENTAYVGKHYMDCVVRSNGSVFAVRRVPVLIKADKVKLLAQTQRSWTKLRTRRGRRR